MYWASTMSKRLGPKTRNMFQLFSFDTEAIIHIHCNKAGRRVYIVLHGWRRTRSSSWCASKWTSEDPYIPTLLPGAWAHRSSVTRFRLVCIFNITQNVFKASKNSSYSCLIAVGWLTLERSCKVQEQNVKWVYDKRAPLMAVADLSKFSWTHARTPFLPVLSVTFQELLALLDNKAPLSEVFELNEAFWS